MILNIVPLLGVLVIGFGYIVFAMGETKKGFINAFGRVIGLFIMAAGIAITVLVFLWPEFIMQFFYWMSLI